MPRTGSSASGGRTSAFTTQPAGGGFSDQRKGRVNRQGEYRPRRRELGTPAFRECARAARPRIGASLAIEFAQTDASAGQARHDCFCFRHRFWPGECYGDLAQLRDDALLAGGEQADNLSGRGGRRQFCLRRGAGAQRLWRRRARKRTTGQQIVGSPSRQPRSAVVLESEHADQGAADDRSAATMPDRGAQSEPVAALALHPRPQLRPRHEAGRGQGSWFVSQLLTCSGLRVRLHVPGSGLRR